MAIVLVAATVVALITLWWAGQRGKLGKLCVSHLQTRQMQKGAPRGATDDAAS